MTSPIAFPLTQPEIDFETSAGSRIRRTVLGNGLRILSESMPASSSATIGFWVGVGSRDEVATQADGTGSGFGSTHFLEHLLFKGTPSRTALDIAVSFDSVGGEHNAMTAKEYTCYYARVRDQDLGMATTVLADMIASSTIDPEEFERERGVILEELAMREDDPGTAVWELLFAGVLGEHPLGRPIGGTADTINATTRDAVIEHYRRNYRAEDVVIAAAGAVDHDILVADVTRALVAAGWDLSRKSTPVERRSLVGVETTRAASLCIEHRPIEQVHLLIGGTGIAMRDDRWLTMSMLNSILGGGMSSRLFQEIREKRGLAYSVYSFSTSYSDAGVFGLGAACTAAKAREVADLMVAELAQMADELVTPDEMTRALGQLSGASALALEESDSRMTRLGRADLILGEFLDLDTTLEKLAAVTADDIRDLARDLISRPLTVAAVGAIDESVFDGFGVSSERERS